ncbi:D-alanine--D-alanine ligase family protein [Vibrio aerogenes]|uniref:hypothetical protein n=1 Tax=Vibrio aerogenes TaxID=92172 RepID=UPI0021C32289|nr:hypothetical protein [Vibrio aerogenes]
MKTNILDKLKSYLHIAVIYAGDPSEPNVVQYKTHNPRYWKSYIDVATDIKISLENSGFSHVHLIREDKNLMQKLQYKKINFAWLNTAGVQGIDSSAHAACVLESLGIPYVGHTPANTMLMDNKHLFKLYLKSSGIKTAPHFLWHHVREEDTYQSRQLALFCKQFEKPEYHARFQEKTRFIVKPVCGRASQHVYIANTPAEVEPLCWRVSRHTNHYVMVELFLSGAEYCVAAMKPPPGCTLIFHHLMKKTYVALHTLSAG